MRIHRAPYGIKIDPAPIYAPEKTGKVESSVKCVKASFFAARDGADADGTKRELQRWVDEIANTRMHGGPGGRRRAVRTAP